jgi:hypothetical protein
MREFASKIMRGLENIKEESEKMLNSRRNRFVSSSEEMKGASVQTKR